MNRSRWIVVVGGVLALAVVSVTLALAHGMAALHAGQRAGMHTDRQTAALDAEIALGRYAASHLASERSHAAASLQALPSVTDDHSILAAVVAAAMASGTTLADEQRGPAASAGATGIVRVPVTIDLNATTLASLVSFAGDLELQPRLFSVSVLQFSTAGGDSLHVVSSAYTAPLAPTSVGGLPAASP
jgi:hypothetical protein